MSEIIDLKQEIQKSTLSANLFFACYTDDVPQNGGACVKYKDDQIAIFNFTRRGEWFATQNLCPHKQQMALSRGMIGSSGDDCEPKVACPFHKKTFSLKTGECLSGDDYQLKTYLVVINDGKVFIKID
ncbi:nitrite reductase small subunit NirD [Pedobacter cryophilus]|uniref:Nitrite reductase small subunit NirD n=1 Tax=Pedobacter cryophilus TaxID=2571271 RepID=A0A4U1BX76_9SPHI|nr:nitrite reductase small subunit NirD [Pedobacter cryophilus]TKB97606.1 nitrite reductase small subunit NirD [Pedobacter cryophilus]